MSRTFFFYDFVHKTLNSTVMCSDYFFYQDIDEISRDKYDKTNFN